jgi:transposase
LDYPGFNFSVLSEFRDRVLAHDAEARLFDRLVEQLRGLGVIKQRGRQRTDSLAVLTKVRDLNRLERACETLRLALHALLDADPTWTRSSVPHTWEERYGERCVAARLSEDQRQTLEQEVGSDGQWLLERLHAETTPARLQDLPQVQVLQTVWSQQFEMVEGKLVYRAGGPYDGRAQIQTPHDPEARYSKKRGTGWIGDKLQVTETDDEDYPHVITDIATTSSVKADSTELKEIQARLKARGVLPGEQLVDAAYVSGPNLKHSQSLGVDLIGPVQGGQSPQGQIPDGMTHDQFRLDEEANVVICPAGQLSKPGRPHGSIGIQFRFQDNTCMACSLRARCCMGPKGRTITLSPDHKLLSAARVRQSTDEFKSLYRQHRGGIEGCLSVVARKYGLRVKRYIGQRKGHLQALFTGVAVNLRRAASWLAKQRPQVRRKGLGLVLNSPAVP